MVNVGGAIQELLTQAGGDKRPGASEAQINELEQRLRVRLPDDLREFLGWSNGWDSEFGETWLVLESLDGIADANDDGFRDDFPGYVAIGGNGGLETFALDYGGGIAPTALVAIDRNSASAQDIWYIASSVAEELRRLLSQPSSQMKRQNC
jgi:hypothetical protein